MIVVRDTKFEKMRKMIRHRSFVIILLGLRSLDIVNAADEGKQCNKTNAAGDAEEVPRLGLPAGWSETQTGSQKLVLGESYNLYDKMGPLVINDDGSTRRIANWDVLTEKEKQTTLRVLSKRNKVSPRLCKPTP